jgi:hypothetical protein
MKPIDKDKVVAEIEKRIKETESMRSMVDPFWEGQISAFDSVLKILDTLKVKEVDTWHLQEKENIYDAVKDWSLHTFVCLMKDGTIQRFSGNFDEDYEGHINVHIDGVNGDYDNVDDIVKWIEYT